MRKPKRQFQTQSAKHFLRRLTDPANNRPKPVLFAMLDKNSDGKIEVKIIRPEAIPVRTFDSEITADAYLDLHRSPDDGSGAIRSIIIQSPAISGIGQ